MATNEQAEKSFGDMTNRRQKFARIDNVDATVVSELSRSAFRDGNRRASPAVHCCSQLDISLGKPFSEEMMR